MKKVLFSILTLLILSACGLSNASDSPTVVPTIQTKPTLIPLTETIGETEESACISTEPTQEDIDQALEFTGKLFENEQWEQSYTVMDSRVAVTWLHVDGFLAYLEALIYPCGYEELDVDNYFSEENWEIILENYESYTIEAECRNDSGLRLYELFVVAGEIEYEMRYWAVNDTDTRVITFMLVFPLGFENMMDQYAYSIFPTLDTCE
jgi:hypothetical protein